MKPSDIGGVKGRFEQTIAPVDDKPSYRMDRSVHYFAYSEKMLSFAGLWHTQTDRQRLLRYYVVGFMSLYCVLGQLCQLYTSNFDFISAIHLLQIFVPTLSGMAMYYSCIFNFNTIKQIYSFILQDSLIVDDDTELNIMQKYAHYGNSITFIGFVMTYSHLIMNVTSSLLRMILSSSDIRSDLDLFPIISCFDYISNRETYYYPIIMYQTLTNFALITASVACYANVLIFVLYVCARLSIIKYKIYSPFINDVHKDDTLVTPIDFSPWVIDVIKNLAKTTELMTLINTVFEKSYLFQTSVAFFHLMFDFLCIPVLLEQKTLSKNAIGLIIYIFGTLFVIYLNCFIGQKLMDYSSDVYREACLVPFQDMSLKSQKLLLTMLTMNSKPYALSVGTIYVESHEFFSNVIRTALSFAMIVYSLRNV